MNLNELLRAELKGEATKARATLERVPAGRGDYKPHPKSMTLARLAGFVAQLSGFGVPILTAPQLDFATAGLKPLETTDRAELLKTLDDGIKASLRALGGVTDAAWLEPWTLCMGKQVIYSGTRFLAYRDMFVNHLVHHRAQLGVYLRLMGVAVPSIYGPSADEE